MTKRSKKWVVVTIFATGAILGVFGYTIFDSYSDVVSPLVLEIASTCWWLGSVMWTVAVFGLFMPTKG